VGFDKNKYFILTAAIVIKAISFSFGAKWKPRDDWRQTMRIGKQTFVHLSAHGMVKFRPGNIVKLLYNGLN